MTCLGVNPAHLAGETGLFRQAVQHVDGPLPGLGLVDAFAKIDGDTRHDSSCRTRPLAFDRPVNVTAEQISGR